MTMRANGLVREIQVAGDLCFEGNRWREAFLYYLNGIWASDVVVTNRPKMTIGNITLRLVGGRYFIYRNDVVVLSSPPPVLNKDFDLVLVPDKNNVEIALVRFVKNNQIRQLGMNFGGYYSLFLTKGNRRGELIVTTMSQLPDMDEVRGLMRAK